MDSQNKSQRVVCPDCYWEGDVEDMRTAAHPFQPLSMCYGCPVCGEIERVMVQVESASIRLVDLIAEWEAEVESEAVAFMERDGMSPGEALDMARTTVNTRRKQAKKESDE